MLFSLGGDARLGLIGAAIVLFSAGVLNAHVGLDTPNGGETLVAGSTFTIEWHAEVQHDTIDWDLWYSTTSDSGPWDVIELDLPLGNPAADVPHFFDWVIPEDFDTTAWIQVRQDNNQDQDYYDESDSSFSILAAGDFNANGQVGSSDLPLWEAGYNKATGVLHSDGDANLDGDVDGTDFLVWQQQSTDVLQTVAVGAVPEPSSWLLFLVGFVVMDYRGRC